MPNERTAQWKNLLKSNGCLKGNRIVAPQNGSVTISFNPSQYLSTDDSVLSFNEIFVIGKPVTAVNFRYDLFYLWQDVTLIRITTK